MPDLRLAKLPDRTPVKITITVSPELSTMFSDCAEIYRRHYGQKEPVEQLVSYIIEAFLNADRSFLKAQKELTSATNPSTYES